MINSSSNLLDFIKDSSNDLHNAGILNAKKELEWFCIKKFNFSLLDIKSDKTDLNKEQYQGLKNFVSRRFKNEPFQYIINSAPFLQYDFYVNSSVLIPRPETETIINILKNQHFVNALDIGTGCGNLAISLYLEKISKNITAIDCSIDAINIAIENSIQLNSKNINFLVQDIFTYKPKKKYDLIVSNPPYISFRDYKLLPEDIKIFEPDIALTDFGDGYMFYVYFSNNLKLLLKSKGTMLLEIGLECTKKKIEKIFFDKADLIWHKDLNGNTRILELNV